ncbi:MAG: VanW protein [Paenibacillaceae bacterium]|nr:VanW protein [Paenibacillaceae bacterium]
MGKMSRPAAILLGSAFVLAATVLTLLWVARLATIPGGVSVAGWNVGGMAYEQFVTRLDQRILALGETKVRLSDGQGRTQPAELTLVQLGLRVDRAALLSKFAGLVNGSPAQRISARWQIHGDSVELPYTFDLAAMEQSLREAWKPMYAAQPVDARRVITADDQVQLVAGQSAYRIDTAAIEARLRPLVGGDLWAGMGDGAGTEQGSEKEAELENGLRNGTVSLELPLVEMQPAVTLDILKAQGVERKLVDFSTSFVGSNVGRMHNIRSTAETIQDQLLGPGDIFDYGKVIQQTEEKYGFQEAPVIVDGKIVPGIGGGICQVSTTLYNAVLRAGLEIVERRNHSLPISYAPLGQDATFAQGYINFKFRNNTNHYVLIRTEIDERQITVKLFGNTPSGTTYEVESSVVQTLPAPDKYVKNSTLQVGAKQLLLKGKPGYVVDTYRITKLDGNEVSRARVSRDTYSPQPNLYASNTGDEPGKAPAPAPAPTPKPSPHIVEDGVKGPVFP